MITKKDFAASERSVAAEQNNIQTGRARIWSRKLLPVFAVIAVCFASTAKLLKADEVIKWNQVATKAASDSGVTGIPLFEARVYAITFAAVHDALNGIDRRYTPYAFTLPVTPGASPEAAVATAAHDVLLDQFSQLVAYVGFSSPQSFIEAEYTAS